MRFSEAWLREFVNPPLSTDQLVGQLTMAGLEVDGIEPVAGQFSGVVVGEVLSLSPHPQADRLRVCKVSAGFTEPLTIVCGAPNVEAGMKAPLALEGGVLPDGTKISKSSLRGVESFGMLCSAKELGMEDSQDGLLALPNDAPVGVDFREYLQLNDVAIEIDLTPNRADCLSVEGIAREVALLNGIAKKSPAFKATEAGCEDTFPVVVDAPADCPRYLGRLIKNLDRNASTPLWMRERLRRSGLRSLGPLVDVTNYVLLELGQPLHAFDAAKLDGSIHVRHGKPDEKLVLLNGQEITLAEDVLVIADERRPLALAGVMGGDGSSVDDSTTNIFLECAFFTPSSIMGKARRYGLSTDSSHRFERGVDPQLQHRAIERASQLLLEIAGGVAGPVTETLSETHLPSRHPILLRESRVEKMLGLAVPRNLLTELLTRLGLKIEELADGWRTIPPGFRFDLAMEADLIEEIGRVYGYDNIPKRNPASRMELQAVSEAILDIERVKDLLVDRGYQEAITYSFVEPGMLAKIEPDLESIALRNPISSDMAVMRTGLWCGLLDAALKNINRQQTRVRLFEAGLRFNRVEGKIIQKKSLAGLALGPGQDEQWGEKTRPVDFFDIKSDLEAILRLAGHENQVIFASNKHPALHPGQSAEILMAGQHLGWLGMLHPKVEKALGFEARVFLFELDHNRLLNRNVPAFKPLSKFPQVRRDIAIIADTQVNGLALRQCVENLSPLIRQVLIFDVYQGTGIESGKKSVALGLVLQDDVETLTDAKVDAVMAVVLARLAEEFNATLRV